MADDWKNRGEKDLSKALEDLYSGPPPPSVVKIDTICRIAVAPRNMKFYKYVVHQIIKHNRSAPIEHRMLLLYIIDAVCKITREQSNVYAERFGKEADTFLEDLMALSRSDWEKALRIFRLWVESDLLPREALAKIDRVCRKNIEKSIFDPLPNEPPVTPGAPPLLPGQSVPPHGGTLPLVPGPAVGGHPAQPHYGRPPPMDGGSAVLPHNSDDDGEKGGVRVNYGATEPRAGDAPLNYTLPPGPYGGQTDPYNSTYASYSGVPLPNAFVPPTFSAADFANVVKMAALWQQAQAQALGQGQGAMGGNPNFPPAFFPPPQAQAPPPGDYGAGRTAPAPYPEEYRGNSAAPQGAAGHEPRGAAPTGDPSSYNTNEYRAAGARDPRDSHRPPEDRGDPRTAPRNDARNDARNDPRNGSRSDPRNESRGDPRDSRPSDPRTASRNESRHDPRGDPPPASTRRDSRSDTSRGGDPRGDPRRDSRGAPSRNGPPSQSYVSPPEGSRAIRGRDSGDPWYYKHPITVKSSAVYLGGVPRDVSERDVRNAFESFGEIRSIGIRGHGGFVQFTFREDAERARDYYQSRELFGRYMKFGWALNPLMNRDSLDKKRGIGQMPPEVLCPEMVEDIRQRGLIIEDPNPPPKPEGVYNSHAPPNDRAGGKRDRDWEPDRHTKRPHY